MKFYTESMPYEWFVRRAHNCQHQLKYGADHSFMRNLMLAEIGSNSVNHLPNYDRQLSTVKMHLEKAFAKFLVMKITEDEENKLKDLVKQIESAHSTSELMEIVEAGLVVTKRVISS